MRPAGGALVLRCSAELSKSKAYAALTRALRECARSVPRLLLSFAEHANPSTHSSVGRVREAPVRPPARFNFNKIPIFVREPGPAGQAEQANCCACLCRPVTFLQVAGKKTNVHAGGPP